LPPPRAPFTIRGVFQRLRVLVRDLPPLLRDIVEDAVGSQDDMEILTDRTIVQPGHAEKPAGPDVIVTATADIDQSEAAAADWLRWRPESRVLVIETTGRRSVMYEMRPHAVRIGDLSRDQLVEVIRSARTGGTSHRVPPS
jgi:DNA-binding NarL/FixJ family response regulator